MKKIDSNLMSPFNADSHLLKKMDSVINTVRPSKIIETGTCIGSTTIALWQMSFYKYDATRKPPQVITIEADKILHKLAIERFKKNVDNRVTPFLARSEDWLKGNLPHMKNELILFYLDAHAVDFGAPGFPIHSELTAIADSKLAIPPVIVIHDFKNPERPDFGYSQGSGIVLEWNDIKSWVDRIYGADNHFHSYNEEADGEKRGVIFIFPTHPALQKGCSQNE